MATNSLTTPSSTTRTRLGAVWEASLLPEGLDRRATEPVPSIREPSELWVPWRCVELVERMRNWGADPWGRLSLRRSSPDAPTPLPEFAKYAHDLMNFLNFARSSLTAYEAQTLSVGLGYTPERVPRATGFAAGDRVAFSATGDALNAQGEAIMVDSNVLLLAQPGARFYVTRLLPVDRANPVKATLLASAAINGA